MRRALPLLAAANFAAAGAGMIIAGILQLIATDLNWSAAQAGNLITYYALGFAIGAPLLGTFMGNWCRKQVVVLGLSLVSLGSLCSALAYNSIGLEISRVVVAAGAAMTVPGTSASAAYLFPADRPRALAFVFAGVTAAIVFGVPIGTLMAGTWGWHAPLFGAAVVAAVATIAIQVFLPDGIVVPPVSLEAWAALLSNPRTYPLLGLSLIFILQHPAESPRRGRGASFRDCSARVEYLSHLRGAGPGNRARRPGTRNRRLACFAVDWCSAGRACYLGVCQLAANAALARR